MGTSKKTILTTEDTEEEQRILDEHLFGSWGLVDAADIQPVTFQTFEQIPFCLSSVS
jgi:hypothetical protein